MLNILILECWKFHVCLFNQSEKSPLSSISQHFSLLRLDVFYQPRSSPETGKRSLWRRNFHTSANRGRELQEKCFVRLGLLTFVNSCTQLQQAGEAGLLSFSPCIMWQKLGEPADSRTAWNRTSRPSGAARTRREHERTGSLFPSPTLWPDLKLDCVVLFQQALVKPPAATQAPTGSKTLTPIFFFFSFLLDTSAQGDEFNYLSCSFCFYNTGSFVVL